MHSSFHQEIIDVLPKLRIQALALTKDRNRAEDLVQDAVCSALSGRDSFQEGTNFPAWIHRILRNRFISDLRKRREVIDVDTLSGENFAIGPSHDHSLVLKELSVALQKLPSDQLEALMMVTMNGISYEDLAEITGCAVGTAKSRVFRARRQLQQWLLGEEEQKNPKVSRKSNVYRKNLTKDSSPMASLD